MTKLLLINLLILLIHFPVLADQWIPLASSSVIANLPIFRIIEIEQEHNISAIKIVANQGSLKFNKVVVKSSQGWAFDKRVKNLEATLDPRLNPFVQANVAILGHINGFELELQKTDNNSEDQICDFTIWGFIQSEMNDL